MKRFLTIIVVIAIVFTLAIDVTAFNDLPKDTSEKIVFLAGILFLGYLFLKKTAHAGLKLSLKLLMILAFLQPIVMGVSIIYSVNTYTPRYPELGLLAGLIVWAPFSIFFVIVGFITLLFYKRSLKY